MSSRLAAVTMVYNEARLLPAWLGHYGSQLGAPHCFVLDHGSDDGSTGPDRPGLRPGEGSVIRIPRSPMDDDRRAASVSQLCASLLNWYDAVIYTDVDELLLADPALHPDLPTFAASLPDDAVVTAFGLDVVHDPVEEPAIDWNRPVLAQRKWLRFSSAMCKPALIRRPVRWVPGFHCLALSEEDRTPRFGPLFLLHLRYADLPTGLERLRRTREQPWASADAGQHQRMADANWEAMVRGMAALPRRAPDLMPDDPTVEHWCQMVLASQAGREGQTYAIDLHLSGDELWRMPERFRRPLSGGAFRPGIRNPGGGIGFVF
ncbi:glycosyltransferase family 2 protein [Rhizosaccharibacter radicis]|uniref:Glycosyltransferase family 2 protein n=1 Tax=Rhizosaccharibacter radicis TaxID=2782605 RepID=A0ABT1VX88_9PROT|nr:glycosyltransferase family 2 protein [Acetobacteraceae bacterium KSS12]